MASDDRPGRGDGLVPRDADPRRSHPAWEVLAERQRDFCDGLAALAATWGAVEIRHELELAVAVTDIWRRADALLGEYLCDVWRALLALRAVEPSWRCPSLERDLSPDASLVLVTARAAARAVAGCGAEDGWDESDVKLRQQTVAIRSALHRMVLGYPVLDPLSDVTAAPPPYCCSPSEGPTDDITEPAAGSVTLRLIR